MTSIRIGFLATFCFLAGLCPVSYAASRIVPDQIPTIQAAIDSSATGDTVLVRAGIYEESLAVKVPLVILGEGAERTVLEGAETVRLLQVDHSYGARTTVQGLTLRNGRAHGGGGVRLSANSSLNLYRCWFLTNHGGTPETGCGQGGGLFLEEGSQVEIDGCVFEGNIGWGTLSTLGQGGAIFAGERTQVDIAGTTFIDNVVGGFEGGIGGAIYGGRASSIHAVGCEFRGNDAQYGAAVQFYGSLELSNSVLKENKGWWSLIESPPEFGREGSVATITHNAIIDNAVVGVRLYQMIEGLVQYNTIVGNQGGILLREPASQATTIEISNNVIVSNGYGIDNTNSDAPANGVFLIQCNDVWGNGSSNDRNYLGPDLTGTSGNISQNPLFCSVAGGDYRVSSASPCLPANRPGNTCPRMGFFGVGCESTPVLSTTWGGIKTRYRAGDPGL